MDANPTSVVQTRIMTNHTRIHEIIAFIVYATVFILQSYAPAPHHIEPAYVPVTEYLDLTFEELGIEYRVTDAELIAAEEKQKGATRKGLLTNVFLLGSGALIDGPREEVA